MTTTIDMFGADSGAVFSPDRRHRYKLWRIWDDRPPLVWVCCNPSIADEIDLDPTLRRCRKFSSSWGHGGMVILNLFALVSTDPGGLAEHPDPVGPDNDKTIRHETLGKRVIVGWGTIGGKYEERVRQVAQLLPTSVECLRMTKDGHPEHPLYLPSDTQPVLWAPRDRYA